MLDIMRHEAKKMTTLDDTMMNRACDKEAT